MSDQVDAMLEYLTGPQVGISRDTAELIMQDADLWFLHPGMRSGFEGTDAVEQWEEAVAFIRGLDDMAWWSANRVFNDATRQVLTDARARAEEALRRARERAA